MKPPLQDNRTRGGTKIWTNLVTTDKAREMNDLKGILCGSGNSLMDQGPRYSVSPGVSSVEKGVEVGQQGVADVQIISGGIHQQRVFTKGSRILVLEENEANMRHFHCILIVCSLVITGFLR